MDNKTYLVLDSSCRRMCPFRSARALTTSIVTSVVPTELVAARIAKGLVATLCIQLHNRQLAFGSFHALCRRGLTVLGNFRVLRALGALAAGRDTQCPALLEHCLVQGQGLGHAVTVLEKYVTNALTDQCGGIADNTHALDVIVTVVQRLKIKM